LIDFNFQIVGEPIMRSTRCSFVVLVFLLLFSQFGTMIHAEDRLPQKAQTFPVMLMLNSNIKVIQTAEDPKAVNRIDNSDASKTPFMKDGRSMVPLRILAEHFGGVLKYVNDEEIHADWNGQSMIFSLSSPLMQLNGSVVTLPIAPIKYNGSTYVPLKAVIEASGEHVYFDHGAVYIGETTDELLAKQALTDDLPLLKKGLPYLVYQGDALLDSFGVKEDAIAYAKTLDSAAVKARDGQSLWDYTMMKTVYLSFDDGPNDQTSAILDILSKYKIHAAFFMLGPQIEKHPDLVKRVVNEGHSIGLHGVTHVANLIFSTPNSVVQEMNSCRASLNKITNVSTNLIRVPYGSKPYMKQAYRDAIVNAGYKMWDWNVDSMDSRGADTPAIIQTTIKQIAEKDHPIILFHDKSTTVRALPTIIEYLIQHDYTFKLIRSNMKPVNFWNDTR
jgi:peptidoglycan/xylan/chitin deacetylase (PgdA/CDA1 family)